MIITQIGEKFSNQMTNADTTGIQILYRFTLADFAILNVGAAINATTAGRIPLKIRSTMTLSLKLWKNNAMARIMKNDGNIVPKVVTILPRIPLSLYPVSYTHLTLPTIA